MRPTINTRSLAPIRALVKARPHDGARDDGVEGEKGSSHAHSEGRHKRVRKAQGCHPRASAQIRGKVLLLANCYLLFAGCWLFLRDSNLSSAATICSPTASPGCRCARIASTEYGLVKPSTV